MGTDDHEWGGGGLLRVEAGGVAGVSGLSEPGYNGW